MFNKKNMYSLINKVLLCMVILLFTNSNIFSQGKNQISDTISENNFIPLKLPSLDYLLNTINESHLANLYKYKIIEQESTIRTEKRKWLNYFRFSSAYQYGYLGGELITQSSILPSAYYQATESAQNYYHIGMSLSIPLDDIVDRHNKIKKEKVKIEQIKTDKEISLNEIRMLVIDLYTKSQQYLALLNTRYEDLKLAESQYKLSQNDFINGKISATELNNNRGVYSDKITEIETSKAEFQACIYKLEILCNIKLSQNR